MRAIAEIQRRLSADPDIAYEVHDHHIVVEPASEEGFVVSLFELDGELVVRFGSLWHEHCNSVEEAVNLFGFGLGPHCRLMVLLRGDLECRATVQRLDNDQWLDVSTTGLLLQPFWRRGRIQYRQNNVLPCCGDTG